MGSLKKEKLDFIKRHEDEILPIIKDRDVAQDIVKESDNLEIENVLEKILEEFETKLYLLEKKKSDGEALDILITAEDPGAYNAVAPILSELKRDKRCGRIGVLIDGKAGGSFYDDFGSEYKKIRDEKTLLGDLLATVEKKPFDIILGTLSSANGPEGVVLYGGKTILRASKLFLINEGWGTMGSFFDANNKTNNLEKIDGIFCEDLLAKEMILKEFPEIGEDRIYVTGTPIVGSLGVEHAALYRSEFRDEFNIGSNDFVIAYFATISSAYKRFGADPHMEETALALSLEAIEGFAANNKDAKIVLALKTHPRDPHSEILSNTLNKNKPIPNLTFKIMPGSYDAHKFSYGADLIVGTMSTELFLAPLRGRRSIILGYDGVGLGGGVLKTMYGEKIFSKIDNGLGTRSLVTSPDQLIRVLEQPIGVHSAVNLNGSVERILDIVFKK